MKWITDFAMFSICYKVCDMRFLDSPNQYYDSVFPFLLHAYMAGAMLCQLWPLCSWTIYLVWCVCALIIYYYVYVHRSYIFFMYMCTDHILFFMCMCTDHIVLFICTKMLFLIVDGLDSVVIGTLRQKISLDLAYFQQHPTIKVSIAYS